MARLGRKTRLGENQRELLWSIFNRVRAGLTERHLVTLPGVFARVTEHVSGGTESPYDFVVVDESQDISVPQLRFLAALRGGHQDGLFFAGDLGQRIVQTPFSWLSLGIDNLWLVQQRADLDSLDARSRPVEGCVPGCAPAQAQSPPLGRSRQRRPRLGS